MRITHIHHSSIIIADTKKSLDFYCGVLDLEVDTSRPDLGYPGAWVQVGEHQIHLLELPNPDPISGRPEHGGRDRHIAMGVEDFEGLVQKLEEHHIPFSQSKSGRKALFCRDPDGNALEFIA